MPRRFPRILAVLIGTALASTVLISSAEAAPTASASMTGATLVAKGAAVDVSFLYSCSPGGDFDGFNVTVTQRVSGGRVTTASGNGPVACDGVQHTGVVQVLAQSGLAFKKGTALANWQLTACDDVSCIGVTGSETVRIR